MSEPTPSKCPECHAPLKISVLRSARSEELLLECPVCGYTAFAASGFSESLRQKMADLFEQVSLLHPFSLLKTLRDPRHSITDKLITLMAKLGTTILDHKAFLSLIAFFSVVLGRRSLGLLVASAVMACMVLHRDIVRKRIEDQVREELD